MDYSLLIGIHGIEKGNEEQVRDQRLALIEVNTRGRGGGLGNRKKAKNDSCIDTSTETTENNPVYRQSDSFGCHSTYPRVSPHLSPVSHSHPSLLRHCVFYADHGGFQSSDCNDTNTDLLYFIGVIDFLTPYTLIKKTEHLLKSITQDKV
jgi:1-phosphatidylinositol-4-phosphate 5-kinase